MSHALLNSLNSLLYALIPAATMLGGGVLATFWVPRPSWQSAILHFAAGVVFSVVAVELLPDIVRGHAPLEVIIGFAPGIAVMLGLRHLARLLAPAETGNASAGTALSPGLLLGIGIDVVIDGLLLGIGFAAGMKEGVLLTLALAVELLSLGLATAAQLSQASVSRPKAILVILGLALLFLAGGAAGATLLQGLTSHILTVVLSFGLAALLFLVTEELLVEAHEEEETPLLTASFFVGFLLFLLLGMVA